MAGAAGATTVMEDVDAGRTMDTAFALSEGTTRIAGTVKNTKISDVDLYVFSLETASRMTIRMLSDDFDSNLLLFNHLGQGLAGNDDRSLLFSSCGGDMNFSDSCLNLSLDAGVYYLGAGANNMAAFKNETDAARGRSHFLHDDSGVLRAPTALALGVLGAEGGDMDINREGKYWIEFSRAVDAPIPAVPLPESLSLLLGGVVALAGVRRVRRHR